VTKGRGSAKDRGITVLRACLMNNLSRNWGAFSWKGIFGVVFLATSLRMRKVGEGRFLKGEKELRGRGRLCSEKLKVRMDGTV